MRPSLTSGSTAQSQLSLCELLDKLALDETCVLNVFQYGSRVYGTSSDDSDWDFTIVIEDGYVVPKSAATTLVETIYEVDNIDANIHSLAEFSQMVKDHDLRALVCIFLPPEHVWKQTIDFAALFHLNLSLLRDPVSTISRKAYGYANICQREGDIRKAKKNLVHSVRFIRFGLQIAKHGRITNYQVANGYFHELMRHDSGASAEEWEVLRRNNKRLGKRLTLKLGKFLPTKVKTTTTSTAHQRWREKLKQQRREKKWGVGGKVFEQLKGKELEEYNKKMEEEILAMKDGLTQEVDAREGAALIAYYMIARLTDEH